MSQLTILKAIYRDYMIVCIVGFIVALHLQSQFKGFNAYAYTPAMVKSNFAVIFSEPQAFTLWILVTIFSTCLGFRTWSKARG